MWWLKREDRGASMVLTAISLVFLIGFAGLAVDVGALYAERTELQKGAEAAALAIAEDCAHGTRPCDVPTATATAEDYIAANATDLAGALDSLDLDLTAQEVTVIDATERSDGGSIFLPFFAQVIGWEGMTVKAQAIARWGTLGSHNTVPITVSMCDIYDPETGELIEGDITFHEPGEGTCDGHPGFDQVDDGDPMPAGFGGLEADETCGAYTQAYTYNDINMWAFQGSGGSFEHLRNNDCLRVGDSYVIPVFVDHVFNNVDPCPEIRAIRNAASNDSDCYGIGGYAHFTLLGYRFPGYSDGDPGCAPPDSCITGTVTKYTESGEIGESFDFGVVVVELIG